MKNSKREFIIPADNTVIGAYKMIALMMKDPDFDIKETMTDTYLLELGYELGLRDEATRRIIEFMYNNHLLN